jgi:hypothetical protein
VFGYLMAGKKCSRILALGVAVVPLNNFLNFFFSAMGELQTG